MENGINLCHYIHMAKINRPEGGSDLDLRMLPHWAAQYDELGAQIKFLEERRTALKKDLSNVVESIGYEDDRGSLYYDVDPATTLKKEKRVTQGFDEEKALDILKEKYPELFDSLTYTVVAVDQDGLLAARYAEDIGEDDFNLCFPKRITYAFKIVKQEVADDDGTDA